MKKILIWIIVRNNLEKYALKKIKNKLVKMKFLHEYICSIFKYDFLFKFYDFLFKFHEFLFIF